MRIEVDLYESLECMDCGKRKPLWAAVRHKCSGGRWSRFDGNIAVVVWRCTTEGIYLASMSRMARMAISRVRYEAAGDRSRLHLESRACGKAPWSKIKEPKANALFTTKIRGYVSAWRPSHGVPRMSGNNPGQAGDGDEAEG